MPTPHPSTPAIGSGTPARWSSQEPPLSGELGRLTRSPDSSFSLLHRFCLSHKRRTNSVIAEYMGIQIKRRAVMPLVEEADRMARYRSRYALIYKPSVLRDVYILK